MTSNSAQPTPEWPPSGPTSSEPLDALPPAEENLAAADGRWHTGPLDLGHTGPLDLRHTGPQGRWPAGGRWPATRAPWPGPATDRPASVLERGTGQQAAVALEPAGASGPEGPAGPGEERLAIICYLSVPFLGPLVPLIVYLVKKRASGYARRQSVQALNLSVTALIYTFCALILGTMLALDSVTLALAVVVPLAAVLWLVTLVYLILAASRASRGDYYRVPAWLCATILR